MALNSALPSISSSGIKAILSALQQMGLDIQTLQDEVGLSAFNLEDTDLRISCAYSIEIYNLAQKYWQGENFGLQHGLHYQPFMLGIVGHLAATAKTGLDALLNFVTYQKACGEGLRLDILESDSAPTVSASMWIHPAMEDKADPGMVDSFFVALMNCTRLLTGRSDQLIRVELKRPKPESSQEYQKVFACHVLFSQSQDKLVLCRKLLDVPLLTANPALHQLLTMQSHSILNKIEDEHDFSNRVRHEMVRCIDGNKIDIERVAGNLCISARTLQRKLKEKEQQFQQLLDEVRTEFATFQLKQNTISIDEQAYLLGFSEPSVYRKSFKRWTGQTPSEFRKSLEAG